MVDSVERCPVCAGPLLGSDLFGHLASGELCHKGCMPAPGGALLNRAYLLLLIKDWYKWRNDTTHPDAEKHAKLVMIESEMSHIAREAE